MAPTSTCTSVIATSTSRPAATDTLGTNYALAATTVAPASQVPGDSAIHIAAVASRA
jgi:hypothetical protein